MRRTGPIAAIAAIIVAALLTTLLGAQPTAAKNRDRPVLEPPVAVRHGVVRLAGRVGHSRHVVLQRRRQGQWKRVKRVRVRSHRFVTHVRTKGRTQRLRVVAGGRRSRVRVVPPTPAPVAGPTPAAAPVDACGVRPAKSDGSWWSCTLADDFDGTELDRDVWVPQTVFATGDPQGRYACYRDHPDNIQVGGGALHLTLREEPAPLPCGEPGRGPSPYTAGMVSTYRLFSQRHGRFEARIRATATSAPGLQEAFWLWPDDRQTIPVLWPEAGEIDIAETYSVHPDLAIPFLHYTLDDNGGPVPGLNTAWDCQRLAGGLQHLHARVVGHPDGDPRQRPHLPGQHQRRPGLPAGLHRGAHAGARDGRQRPRRHRSDPGHDERRLRARLALSATRVPVGGAAGRGGTMDP